MGFKAAQASPQTLGDLVGQELSVVDGVRVHWHKLQRERKLELMNVKSYDIPQT